jgi:hypothetical protein
MRAMLLAIGWLGLFSGPGRGQAESFPFDEWTSADGKKLSARLIRLEGDAVWLRMKDGGKRVSVKLDKLGDASKALLDGYRASVTAEIEGGAIGTSTIFRSVALGLGEQTAKALIDKELYFAVTDIRVDTNRNGADLELDKALFVRVLPPRNWEYHEKEDALFITPVRGKGSRLRIRKGARYKIKFTKDTLFEFGTVGIADGVIIHR